MKRKARQTTGLFFFYGLLDGDGFGDPIMWLLFIECIDDGLALGEAIIWLLCIE